MPSQNTLFSNPGLAPSPASSQAPLHQTWVKKQNLSAATRLLDQETRAPRIIQDPTETTRFDRLISTPFRETASRVMAQGVPTRLLQAAVEARRNKASLASFCRNTFHFASLDEAALPTLMVGPPGVGKSMAACRLARRLQRIHGRAALIFIDQNRPDMELFMRIVAQKAGFEFYSEANLDAYAYRLDSLRDTTPCVLDGVEISPKHVSKNDNIMHIVNKIDAEPVLVLSAAMAPSIIDPLLAQAARVGVRRSLTSQLDHCSCLSGLLTAATHDSIGLAAVSDAPGPLGALQDASPDLFIHLLETGNLNKMSA